jgi:alcohol dehydrogenase class IV
VVRSFSFARIPSIIFGRGRISELAGIIRERGQNLLLVTSARSFANSTYAMPLFARLENEGITVSHISVAGEPSPETVDKAVAGFSGIKIDVVTAIGGGSVIDAGKAISAMLKTPGSVKDYLEVIGNRDHPGTKVPFIAVPTTSGTGSEATKNAVLSIIGKGGFKRSLRHDNLVPDFALVDPLLTVSCPPDITAAAGMDCFTQLTEAYLSAKATEYTDALAIEGIKAVRRSLVKSYENGDDIGARTDMSFAALTSGICLANAGLGVVHGLAGTIGALYDIPHGVACGTLMAVANDVSVRELRKISGGHLPLKKYAVLGRIFSDSPDKEDDYYTDHFIAFLHELTDRLNLPHLGDYGIGTGDLELISLQSDVKNNPVDLPAAVRSEILARRL